MPSSVQRPHAEDVDLLIAGGGVVGLWVARRALEQGLRVLLVDERGVGGGASGGLLGALMAHTPEPWTEDKQFQFDALCALPGLVDALEAETGHDVGYARVGRLIPMRDPAFWEEARRREAAAAEIWGARDAGFVLRPEPAATVPAIAEGWIAEAAAPEGCVWDSFAARLNPRRYLGALAAALTAHPRGALREGVGVSDCAADGAGLRVTLSDGAVVQAGGLVLAAGYETFALAERLGAPALRGDGVKGQGAVFDIAAPSGAPLLYDRGVYVVPHADGRIAVGSTSQAQWSGEPGAVDPAQRGFLERAAALCPRLAGATPSAEWAGVRPRSASRKPLVGAAPGSPSVWVATGGYKISFGIAHAMAAALVDRITGVDAPAPLPQTYAPA